MSLEQDPRITQGPTFFPSLYAWMKRVAVEVNKKVDMSFLLAGYASSYAAGGYLRLPTWLGGLTLQWGSVATSATGASVSFPTAFASNVFGCFVQCQVAGPRFATYQTLSLTGVFLQGWNDSGVQTDVFVNYLAIGR